MIRADYDKLIFLYRSAILNRAPLVCGRIYDLNAEIQKPNTMKKTLLLFILASCTSVIANAQVRPYEAGDQNFAISVNPVFSYVGNLFNDSQSNNLNLTSAGIVYRNFRSPNKATRFSGNISYNQTSSFSTHFNFSTNTASSFTTDFTSVNSNIGIGTEYRKSLTKWSLYSGWQILAAFQQNSFKVDNPASTMDTFYTTESNSGARVSAGPGIFGGAEYFFGDVFFLGMEVSAAALAGYQFAPSNTMTNRTQNSFSLISNEGDGRFIMNVSSANLVIFRAGVRF